MTLRNPICRVPGKTGYSELPATDTLSPTWTGTVSLAAQVIALGAFVRVTATMTSTTGSGTLKAGTPVAIGVTGFPVGLFLVGGSVSFDGTVTLLIGASAVITLSAPVTLTVAAAQPR